MRANHSELERLALDQLEPQLVRGGYQVIRSPMRSDLPAFMEGYIPDAIAIGKEPNIALEIKGRSGSDAERNLGRIRSLFHDRKDWVFQVYYFDTLQPIVVNLPKKILEDQANRVRHLATIDLQPAFVMAWAVLEAVMREHGLVDSSTFGANKMVSILASEGYIKGAEVAKMLDLANLRNSIVHGQLDREPSADDMQQLMDLISAVQQSDDL